MTVTEPQPAEVGGNPAERIYEGVDHLAAALANVQAELPRILAGETAKVTGETKQGKPVSYTYKYAGLATVAAAVLPMLGKHGLSFTSWPTLTGNRFVLRYELLHSSGQRIGGLYPLNEDVRSPQAMGSQITYARRYCLCAVTGVSPDDDDDAAAADAKVSAQREAEQAEQDRERELATQSVMGAWANQYGGWDPQAAADKFKSWSKGGEVATASPAQLRAFTGYLLTLPEQDAGGDPAETESRPGEDRPPVAPAREISDDQRKKMFALMNELGIKERQQQLQFLSDAVGRPLKSRSEVNFDDAQVVIKKLQDGDVAAVETGPRMAGRGQLRALDGAFKKLDIPDAQERLRIAAAIVGRTPVDGDGKPSAVGLTADEATELSTALATCSTRDDALALIRMAEAADASAQEGVQ